MDAIELQSFVTTLRAGLQKRAQVKQAALSPGAAKLLTSLKSMLTTGGQKTWAGLKSFGRGTKALGTGAVHGVGDFANDVLDRGPLKAVGSSFAAPGREARDLWRQRSNGIRSPQLYNIGHGIGQGAPTIVPTAIAADRLGDRLRDKSAAYEAGVRKRLVDQLGEKVAQEWLDNIRESGHMLGNFLGNRFHYLTPTGMGEASAPIRSRGYNTFGNIRNAFGATTRKFLGPTLSRSWMGSDYDRYVKRQNRTGLNNAIDYGNQDVLENLTTHQPVDQYGRLPPPRGTPPMPQRPMGYNYYQTGFQGGDPNRNIGAFGGGLPTGNPYALGA